jgi:hypothetical protein
VKWFNRLYLEMTQQVDAVPPQHQDAPPFLEKLDVVFANRYFAAYDTAGTGALPAGDRGHDVAAATDDPGLRGLRDPDLFEVAQQQGRVLVTYNRVDFEPITGEYAQTNREHHGLVIVHPTRFPSFLVWLQEKQR